MLPMKNFFDYKQILNYHEQQFNDAVEDFLNEYPTLVSAAAFQLGDLFNADVVHVRKPTGRSWDAVMHVDPRAPPGA